MCTGSRFCEEMANNANTPKIKYLNQVKLAGAWCFIHFSDDLIGN